MMLMGCEAGVTVMGAVVTVMGAGVTVMGAGVTVTGAGATLTGEEFTVEGVLSAKSLQPVRVELAGQANEPPARLRLLPPGQYEPDGHSAGAVPAVAT